MFSWRMARNLTSPPENILGIPQLTFFCSGIGLFRCEVGLFCSPVQTLLKETRNTPKDEKENKQGPEKT